MIKLLTKNQRTHKEDGVHMHDCNPALPAQTEERMDRGAKRGKLGCFTVLLVWLHTLMPPLPKSSISSTVYLLYSFIHSLHTELKAANVVLKSAMVGFHLKVIKMYQISVQVVEIGIVWKERPQQVSVRRHMTMGESLSCCCGHFLKQLNVSISDSLRLHGPF